MKVLVTGATGKLGPHIVRELRDRGVHVAAFVRDPGRGRKILGDQVELVPGTFADAEQFERAVAAADALCLLSPHGPDMAEVQCALIDLAAKVGTRVVKVSGTSAAIGPIGPDAARQHGQAEQHLADSGVSWAVVRPNAFMQSLVGLMAQTVRERGVVLDPLAGARLAVVDCADVGAAVATVLTNPGFDGRHYVLTGPTAPTHTEVADEIARATGRAVDVVATTPLQMGEAAQARGLSTWEAGHLVEMLHLFATGTAGVVDDDLPHLLGREARTVGDFIADHRSMFHT